MDRQFALDSRRGTISIIPLLVIGEKTEARQTKSDAKVIWQV